MPNERLVAVAIFITYTLLMMAVGASILWYFTGETAVTTETVRPAEIQRDGSSRIARVPVLPSNMPPAPHIIPDGTKEERRIHLVVKPHPSINADTDPAKPMCSCDPISLDLSLVRGKEGSGLIASSPDADIDIRNSVDTPMLDPIEPPSPNSFTLMGNTEKKAFVGTYTRDFRIFGLKAHADIGLIHTDREAIPVIGAGFRWK